VGVVSQSLSRSRWRASPAAGDHEGTDPAETAWIAAAQADPAAFAPLYERYATPVYRFIHRKVGNPEVANDLTAQVFIKAIERIGRYQPRPGATFRSWLFTIARNTVTDSWRRTRPVAPYEPVAGTLVDQDPGPEALAIAGDEYDALCAVLDHLPDSQRAIVELRLAGLSTAEIMATLGMSGPAVKSAQHRAYRRLRNLVPPEGFMP
jgi:RNA polymerase sigma-70 factor (ECF subfamily)